MPPKRKDKDPDATIKPKTDPIQADTELFLQAFESKFYFFFFSF